MSFWAMAGLTAINPVSIAATLIGDNDSTASTSTRTHTALDVGSSYGKKTIVGVITMEDGAASRTLSTFQLGGVSLTSAVSITHDDGSEFLTSIIFTGDISSLSGSQSWTITATGNVNSSCISAAVLHDVQSLTPVDSATATRTGFSGLLMSVTGTDDGFTIGGAANSEHSAVSATWNTVTERADQGTGGGASDHRHTAAWDIGNVDVNSAAVTWSSGSYHSCGCLAVFR